jgi:hypothetical protein
MDSTSFLSNLMEIRDQNEFYADLQSRPVFFGLSLPPVLPGSLLPSPAQAFPPHTQVRRRPDSVEIFQHFARSAQSLHIKCQEELNRDYCAVLVSSTVSEIDKKQTLDTGLHSPVSVDFFDSVQRMQDSPADSNPTHRVEGAVKRCEASVKRLQRMNEALESLANAAWFSPDHSQTLAERLKINKYYPAIRSKMLDSGLMHHVSQRKIDDIDSDAADPDLFENARKCGPEISDEVSTLQMLEDKTSKTVRAMLESMSGDVPICTEEAKSILSHVKATFNPARAALSAAVRRLAVEKDSHSMIARYATFN